VAPRTLAARIVRCDHAGVPCCVRAGKLVVACFFRRSWTEKMWPAEVPSVNRSLDRRREARLSILVLEPVQERSDARRSEESPLA
jgi:hypothetical protein